jgi:serine/threonine protein kinase
LVNSWPAWSVVLWTTNIPLPYLRAQDHIHKQGVAHRDLKPENILLDAGGVLKISDFGLGAVWMIKDTGKTRQLNDVCGSLPYIAPEVNLVLFSCIEDES